MSRSARAYLRMHHDDGYTPEWGTPECDRLPVGSQRWLNAAVRAAEAWRTYTSPEEVAWRARIDLAQRRADDAADAYWTPDIVAGVHADAQYLLNRCEPYSGAPRAGDHPGGPVAWETAAHNPDGAA